MNNDIALMIELQRYWSNVLQGTADIEKTRKAILYWGDRVRDGEKTLSDLDEAIKKTKIEIQRKEMELADLDAKAKKLDDRTNQVSSEKEMTAVRNELNAVNDARGKVEEEAIRLMDSVEEKSGSRKKAADELQETASQAEKDIATMRERIARFEMLTDENRNNYDASVAKLSPAVKSRFQKLLSSGIGIAIAKVEGETCGACHFQIPAYLISDASKNDKIVNCTNCGRFIYS